MEKFVLAFLIAKDFEGAVGDDLVGVHVSRGAGPALDHVDGEMFVPFPGNDFITSGDDSTGLDGIENAELLVGQGSGFLYISEAADEVTEVMQRDARDGKILHPAQRLHAIVGGVRQLALA